MTDSEQEALIQEAKRLFNLAVSWIGTSKEAKMFEAAAIAYEKAGLQGSADECRGFIRTKS